MNLEATLPWGDHRSWKPHVRTHASGYDLYLKTDGTLWNHLIACSLWHLSTHENPVSYPRDVMGVITASHTHFWHLASSSNRLFRSLLTFLNAVEDACSQKSYLWNWSCQGTVGRLITLLHRHSCQLHYPAAKTCSRNKVEYENKEQVWRQVADECLCVSFVCLWGVWKCQGQVPAHLSQQGILTSSP